MPAFLGRSPDTTTGDDIRRFQRAQVEQGAQPPKMNGQTSALRFFFTIILAAPTSPISWPARTIRANCRGVLTPDQAAQRVEAAPGPGLKHKAALSVAYGAGLRGCELVVLLISDIDSKRI